MPELLRRDDKMVQEIKSLDSDMQMLVYENYNKFIAATDTIRRMRENVAGMEQEMGRLQAHMDSIGECSANAPPNFTERTNATEARYMYWLP